MPTTASWRLTDVQAERGRRVVVDLFFRSLADTHGPHAAAIVLSGADGDGAIGIKRIKERGGLTIAQDPDEAEHGSMPRAAIDTGMVDWVLQVDEMPRPPARLFRSSEQQLRLPPEDGPQPARRRRSADDRDEAALREVLGFLRTRTGRDFSLLQAGHDRCGASPAACRSTAWTTCGLPATSCARIPARRGALLQDLLISVTNFFRDRDAFEALERAAFPSCSRTRRQSDAVRVWVPACATGEEAYSSRCCCSSTRARSRRRRHPGLRLRPRRGRDRRGARRRLPRGDRGRRDARSGCATSSCKEHARLPRAARAARDGAVRRARPAEGLAVLAPGPDLVPQPADLPEPRGAARASRHLPFRAAAGRPAVPRLVGIGRRAAARCSRARQEAPDLRAAAGRARGAAGAARAEHAALALDAQAAVRSAPVVRRRAASSVPPSAGLRDGAAGASRGPRVAGASCTSGCSSASRRPR